MRRMTISTRGLIGGLGVLMLLIGTARFTGLIGLLDQYSSPWVMLFELKIWQTEAISGVIACIGAFLLGWAAQSPPR